VFHGVAIQQAGFAAGAPAAQAHGTATASLIAGRLGGFHGAAPGVSLLVADIYGAAPDGGSAEALARALAWMARQRTPVISVSLVGPDNALVALAVKAVAARGALIVAAVGNDGPAAPPAYPASYPGVVAVTAVDAKGRVLPEAGRALHVDYAAPGAGLQAAESGGGLTAVRGTSFAAPIVAGELARLLPAQEPGAARRALAALDRIARPGRGVGRGIVGEDVRFAGSGR
jgi:subtilisin family serine protease